MNEKYQISFRHTYAKISQLVLIIVDKPYQHQESKPVYFFYAEVRTLPGRAATQ